jgi:hypothetical protein
VVETELLLALLLPLLEDEPELDWLWAAEDVEDTEGLAEEGDWDDATAEGGFEEGAALLEATTETLLGGALDAGAGTELDEGIVDVIDTVELGDEESCALT